MKSTKQGINKLNLAMAILIAFSAWLYVMFEVDPAITKTFHDIPVRIVNESNLTEHDMAVRSVEYETIDVKVEARRSVIVNLENKRIKATADVGDAGKGENIIAVEIDAPSDVRIESKSRDSITIVVDVYESKEVPLAVNVKDDDDKYVRTFEAPESVVIEGYSAELSEIKSIETEETDITKLTETGEVPLSYVLPEGIKVSSDYEDPVMTVYVEEREDTTVTVPAGEIKAAGLDEKFDYEINDDVEITVSGTYDELDGIGYGDFEISVDLSGVTQSGPYEADVTMTTKVERAKLNTSKLTVTITEKESE